MIRKSSFPKVLLLLATFVFFTANTVHILEIDNAELLASDNPTYQFDFDTVKKKGPYLNLKSAILVNYENGQVLYSKNANQVRPIASITKLVAAMVILDKGIDLNRTEKITKKDARRSSRSRLKIGYEVKLEDLLVAALMNSDNRAMRALARATSGSSEAFAVEMNIKVRSLGLKKTLFIEPTGLDKRNVSTAHEVAKIIHYAFKYPELVEITSARKRRIPIQNHKGRYLQMANTNLIVLSPYKVLTGKTGYTRAADYCLGTLVQDKSGERLTVVVLGVPGDKLRFREIRKLIDWGYKQI